jgi:predicted nucleotidyltransferase component of viral defense system
LPHRLHEEAARFRVAVMYTAARLGFVPRLVEKDYYCTVLLEYLASRSAGLVFKGGTCLAKVHLGFYRLSEDLDFAIPVPVEVARNERSQRSALAKQALDALPHAFGGLTIVKPVTASNESRQYVAEIDYASVLGATRESIKVEIGLREPLLLAPEEAAAHTLLLDPISGERHFPAIEIPCITRLEALAEKLRAALTRRVPAIRDFYDIDHAIRRGTLDVTDAAVLGMVRSKLAVPGNPSIDSSAHRLTALRRQVDAQLRPVLRERNFDAFDLERAFAVVESVSSAIAKR